MEVPDSGGSTDGRPTSFQGEKLEPRSVVVAVDATRELQLAALEYALKNCVSPGDNLHLLGILHEVSNPMGYKQKADSKLFNGTNKHIIQEETLKKELEFQKVIDGHAELQKLFDSKQVSPGVIIATGPSRKEVTAKQAGELRATWVILDKNLKRDKAYLVGKLNCNIVLMKPKKEVTIHRVELRADNEIGNSPGPHQEELSIIDVPQVDLSAFPYSSSTDTTVDPSTPPIGQYTGSSLRGFLGSVAQSRLSNGFETVHKSSPASDSVTGSSHFLHGTATVYSRGSTMTELNSPPSKLSVHAEEAAVESDQEANSKMVLEVEKESIPGENVGTVAEHGTAPSLSSAETVVSAGSPHLETAHKTPGRPTPTGDSQSLMARQPAPPVLRPVPRSANEFVGDELMKIFNPSNSPRSEPPVPESLRTLRRSLRDEDLSPENPMSDVSAIGGPSKFGNQNEEDRSSLDNSKGSKKKNQRPVAPLCSKCNHPGPVFGSEAIQFTYAQLEEATNNFDQENYLAEGGYGFVYRGTLKESGQEIAVKQYKPASSQGDDEFYSEVNVLKFAQHRNLVILIGYCAEKNKRLLVYEFVCNKSLDVHLSAKNAVVLEWKSRWKIAVGAATGLRYLHEECRVGCIVHRDLRPNNILCTHDFVPMVGDFGLARSQTDGDNPEETRVIGTLGYLAPEYAESGSITEKADVYSFGVVLLELITGRKAIDATKPRGKTILTEWARPKIQAGETRHLVDPRLNNVYDIDQVNKMVDVAGGCICKDPSQRPKMSEVLRMLERDANSSSMSRDSSANDLSDVSRNPPLQRALQSGNPIRQNSFEGVSIKASVKVTANHPQKEHYSSVPVAISRKTSKEPSNTSEWPSSPRMKQPSSHFGKAPQESSPPSTKTKDRKGPFKLSYLDML